MATTERLAIQDALRDSVAAACARAGLPGAVRALEPGAGGDWRTHWPGLADLGLLGPGVPARLGGAGGDLADTAAALERAAWSLAPGPVLPTVLAALALTGTDAQDLVPALVAGRASAGVALEPGTLTVTGGRISGRAEAVLGAHDDAHLLLAARDGDRTVWAVVEPRTVEALTPLDFSRPLASVDLDGVPVRTVPELAGTAAVLLAAESVGVARWCLDTAVAHAAVREQFGRPIGAFQAVKHLCAEMLCRVERAAALVWDAVREPESLSAPAAVALALDASVANAKDCVQVLGGIGFTWEHDAHLYLRRALATRQLAGGTALWRRRVAARALAGERRTPGVAAEDEPARRAVREFVAGVAGLSEQDTRVRLADSGYLAPHWPRPYGLDATPRAQLVIDEELAAAGIRRPDLVVGAWAVPTILAHGTPEQRERFVRPTLRGELRWCQLFSEPDAGSDLASLRTRARPADGGWVLDGQKVWTSQAREADWAICLARTDPDAAKHAGISYFLVDMRAPGITTRPLREITGEARFNEVFLDGVFVPHERVVGEIGGGWRLARATLATERVALGTSTVDELVALATPDADRERLGALVASGLAVGMVDLRETERQVDGREPGPGASVRKLLATRQRQDVAEFGVEVLGPAGAAVTGETGDRLRELLLSRCLTIAGGTTQVLLTLVGERVLGLPRES
ncbi:hypothetical protein BLA60_31390 [Actinophytocola xinjiangensis]|uniref:Alkylation response protein AidB-like acyl-CoA dehydrogenase n=1 Tax=Actinophytocola xinjiangensis TaxID=485602 RepID=A0A7Z0WG34_9PSEU|nr:acyl-CoA dehydrogenase [Actinophytocola xinjiangensis]OLF06475.1 hypothetical protein BLA60_31390 [Actinophytocola xinjiangensis]